MAIKFKSNINPIAAYSQRFRTPSRSLSSLALYSFRDVTANSTATVSLSRLGEDSQTAPLPPPTSRRSWLPCLSRSLTPGLSLHQAPNLCHCWTRQWREQLALSMNLVTLGVPWVTGWCSFTLHTGLQIRKCRW